MAFLLRKNILSIFFLLLICVTGIKAQKKYINSYISTVSKTLEGVKPEASWIWDDGNPNPEDYYLMVRKRFNLENDPVKASAFISAYSFADVYINGTLIDRCPLNCDPEFQVYENYDIAKYLKKGENVISAMVYNYGIGTHHRINAQGGFFFQGKINVGKRKQIKILTDKTWRVMHASDWEYTGKLRTGSGDRKPNLIGFNERFNASLMPEGWQNAEFEDSGWNEAHEIGVPPVKPWNNIVTVNRPPLNREIALPVRQWKTKDAAVFDFGIEIAGHPVIEINSFKKGIIIEIGTGERLNKDTSVNYTTRVDYTDEYITKEGKQSWSPATWRGFRYLSIKADKNVDIMNVSAQTRGYALKDEGSFECSDSLLNRIWKTGNYSVRLCSQDTYMDTPWREQTQYIAGDSRYLLKYAFYTFGGSSNFLTKYNIISGAESQRWSSEGAIRSRYPTDWLLGKNTSAYLPDYELEWVIMLGEYYNYFGDKDLVKQVYPNMVKLLNYLEGFVSSGHGLMKNAPGWIVLDHPDTYPMDQKEEITGLNCLYYEALAQASFIARQVMNDKANSAKWNTKAGELKNNICKWLWDPDKKLFRDSYGSGKYSQQTQVYALLYGLVEDKAKQDVVQFITEQGKKSEQSFAYYVLYSVFNDKAQWALDYIRQNWGGQMKSPLFNGAWHEAWDIASWTSDFGTTSHAWCAGPSALLPQKVLGVESLEPGWKLFRVKPNTGDLKWAKGIIPSPKGNISIEWKKAGRKILCSLSVPANSAALIELPVENIEKIDKNGKQIVLIGKRKGKGLKLGTGKYSIIYSMNYD